MNKFQSLQPLFENHIKESNRIKRKVCSLRIRTQNCFLREEKLTKKERAFTELSTVLCFKAGIFLVAARKKNRFYSSL